MRIVAFAYACEPGVGSEPGAGWALAQMIATFADVHVITRTNNRAAIEAAGPTDERITFSYVEGSGWARAIKKGQRGIRLYHSSWQRAALAEARRLHAREPFDAAWHLTIANAWLGSRAGDLGIPFIFGPVGGGVTGPRALVRSLGIRAVAFERARVATRALWRTFNPSTRRALDRAALILVQNRETLGWLGARYQDKAKVFQNAVMEAQPSNSPNPHDGPPVACFAGRLLAWKGPALALKAIAATPPWRLIVLGEGPERARLEALAREIGISERVEFRGRVSQEELFRLLGSEVDAFLFPSLHDDSPLAIAEAVACGLPVVCLDIGGPPAIARERAIAIDPHGSPEAVVAGLSNGLARSLDMPRDLEASERLTTSARATELHDLVKEVLF